MFASNIALANVAFIVNFVSMCVTISALTIAYFVIKKQEYISQIAASFPLALETIAYSEIPIAVVAVIADHMKIPLSQVIEEYAKDKQHRRSVVLKAFRKDGVTDRFIRQFPSKFVRNGYLGEELLGSAQN